MTEKMKKVRLDFEYFTRSLVEAKREGLSIRQAADGIRDTVKFAGRNGIPLLPEERKIVSELEL